MSIYIVPEYLHPYDSELIDAISSNIHEHAGFGLEYKLMLEECMIGGGGDLQRVKVVYCMQSVPMVKM